MSGHCWVALIYEEIYNALDGWCPNSRRIVFRAETRDDAELVARNFAIEMTGCDPEGIYPGEPPTGIMLSSDCFYRHDHCRVYVSTVEKKTPQEVAELLVGEVVLSPRRVDGYLEEEICVGYGPAVLSRHAVVRRLHLPRHVVGSDERDVRGRVGEEIASNT